MNLVAHTKIFCRLLATKAARRFGLSQKLPSFLHLDLKRILESSYPAGTNFSFILIGAHDGISHDFLYEFILRRNSAGICIEPQPDIYQELVKNTSFNPNIVTINKAVHPSLKEVTLYRVDPARLKELPEWASGIASLYPNHHERLKVPSLLIEAIQVASDHLMDIVTSHNFAGELDLLQIDTEGFDLEALKMVDFGRLQPSVIRLEHVNLASGDLRSARDILQKQNYVCFCDPMDLIAINLEKIRL